MPVAIHEAGEVAPIPRRLLRVEDGLDLRFFARLVAHLRVGPARGQRQQASEEQKTRGYRHNRQGFWDL